MFGLQNTYTLAFERNGNVRDWCLDLQGLMLGGSTPGERKVNRKAKQKARVRNAAARKARKAGKGGAKRAKNWTQSYKVRRD